MASPTIDVLSCCTHDDSQSVVQDLVRQAEEARRAAKLQQEEYLHGDGSRRNSLDGPPLLHSRSSSDASAPGLRPRAPSDEPYHLPYRRHR
mmetsp:Transcript_7453/g.22043  ORF Transcript_7453/g.22043 Transcript_7453/m.22043 type:complete len:91 (+) Transcript_7453:251-523(+)